MDDLITSSRLDENIERLEGYLADPGLPAVCEYREFLERSIKDLRRRRALLTSVDTP